MILDNLENKIKIIEKSFSRKEKEKINEIEEIIINCIRTEIEKLPSDYSEKDYYLIMDNLSKKIENKNVKLKINTGEVCLKFNSPFEVYFNVWSSIDKLKKRYQLSLKSKLSINFEGEMQIGKDRKYQFSFIGLIDDESKYQNQYKIEMYNKLEIINKSKEFKYFEPISMILRELNIKNVKEIESLTELMNDNNIVLKDIIETINYFNHLLTKESNILTNKN